MFCNIYDQVSHVSHPTQLMTVQVHLFAGAVIRQ
jgi:hypothetical protein